MNLADIKSTILYTKIQPQRLSCFFVFLPYVGMAAILFNHVNPFRYIVKTSFDRRPLVKSGENGQWVSGKKSFKDYTDLYMYIVPGQGLKTIKDKI